MIEESLKLFQQSSRYEGTLCVFSRENADVLCLQRRLGEKSQIDDFVVERFPFSARNRFDQFKCFAKPVCICEVEYPLPMGIGIPWTFRCVRQILWQSGPINSVPLIAEQTRVEAVSS